MEYVGWVAAGRGVFTRAADIAAMLLKCILVICILYLVMGACCMFEWLTYVPPPGSVLTYVLSDWVPALITIFVGGVIASFVFPGISAFISERATQIKTREKISTDAAVAFRKYRIAWYRLMTIAAQEKLAPDKVTQEINDRKKGYVEDRDKWKDELISVLMAAKMNFTKDASDTVDAFFAWDESLHNKSLSELPQRGEWVEWEKKLIEKLHSEIRP